MDEMAVILRLLIMVLFLASAGVSIYAARKVNRYHLWGIAAWCIHVVVFTGSATLSASHVLTISHEWLNMWSNTVRLHGGIVALSIALFYAARPRVT